MATAEIVLFNWNKLRGFATVLVSVDGGPVEELHLDKEAIKGEGVARFDLAKVLEQTEVAVKAPAETRLKMAEVFTAQQKEALTAARSKTVAEEPVSLEGSR